MILPFCCLAAFVQLALSQCNANYATWEATAPVATEFIWASTNGGGDGSFKSKATTLSGAIAAAKISLAAKKPTRIELLGGTYNGAYIEDLIGYEQAPLWFGAAVGEQVRCTQAIEPFAVVDLRLSS